MLSDILFVDIETASQHPVFDEVPIRGQELWLHKMKRNIHDVSEENIWDIATQLYSQKAAIYAEFGKIICICVGLIVRKESGYIFRTISYTGEENEILSSFFKMISDYSEKRDVFICGHNLREFDVPYIARRSKILGSSLPHVLQVQGKKPWDLEYLIDTMQLWRFGDYKSYTSLDLLAYTLDIPSPKDGMHGAQVNDAYWQGDRLEEIVEYCKKDIFTTAQIYLRLTDQHIEVVLE